MREGGAEGILEKQASFRGTFSSWYHLFCQMCISLLMSFTSWVPTVSLLCLLLLCCVCFSLIMDSAVSMASLLFLIVLNVTKKKVYQKKGKVGGNLSYVFCHLRGLWNAWSTPGRKVPVLTICTSDGSASVCWQFCMQFSLQLVNNEPFAVAVEQLQKTVSQHFFLPQHPVTATPLFSLHVYQKMTFINNDNLDY